MANKSSLDIDVSGGLKDFRKKNNVGEYQKSEPVFTPIKATVEPIREENAPVKRSVGRQPKERKLGKDYPKTIYFDQQTSMKLSDIRTKDKIDIKDVVLVATIEFLNRNFNEDLRGLTEAGKALVRKEMDRILDSIEE